ncbi:hypothetical protein CC86DRAFT_372976 [Ophiobolus disseminans]|uniref:F-box domain-containing protein n=1 Tax=Ophiobolus disseminans TaxID=1469910 RepID=A0A6A6ZQ85_9PLEO|nr:hypothetical protein CC86DRAFT_372976 [Ophiobolus disseminans]
MFSLFAPEPPRPSKPVLAILPPRASCGPECNHQQQSPFYNKLPPELRNEVYKHIFTGETRELLSVEAHPLSMLLTCHKVNHEATNLAFNRHTFPISDNIGGAVFLSLRNATAHLTSQQADAITKLSYDQGRKYIQGDVKGTARILANAILVFPNFEQFEIRNLRSHNAARTHDFPPTNWHIYHGKRVSVTNKYAPHWFTTVLACSVDGRAYSWQSGERWSIKWPQVKENEYLHFQEETDGHGETVYTPYMSPSAVGTMRGVQMCPCLCGNVEWTSVDLVQEHGRKIAVNFVYHGPNDRPLPTFDEDIMLKIKLGPKAIVLREGVAPLDPVEDTHKNTSTSFGYDANEEYWDGLRSRNGGWIATSRIWWRSLTQGAEANRLPGSKFFGEGDWAQTRHMS